MPTTAVWILGDQLLLRHPALERAAEDRGQDSVVVVLVESRRILTRRPCHRQRAALVLSALRHYARELEQAGWRVDRVQADTMVEGLRAACERCGAERLLTMAASRGGGRAAQARLEAALGIPVEVLANRQFLWQRADPFPDAGPDDRVVMESFYRSMRRHFDVLMDGDEPAGGRWNFDRENREPLPDRIEPPETPVFEHDAVTEEVLTEIESDDRAPFVGRLRPFRWPVTRAQARQALSDFVERRLHRFGPYQDALSRRHPFLFHSLLSPALNVGLLEPLEVIRAAEQAHREAGAPIASVEGFVRQVLGWREFMSWQSFRFPDLEDANHWRHRGALPDFYWNGETDMACVRSALEKAIDTGYAHHIERLMVLGNLSLLLGIEPRLVYRWFLAMFVDGFDWVMAPNVMGMALYADGGRIATKPYVASANYIHRMGDHCGACRYRHRERHGDDACPFNALYWSFVLEHEDELRAHPRSSRLALGLRHLDDEERRRVRRRARRLRRDLGVEQGGR